MIFLSGRIKRAAKPQKKNPRPTKPTGKRVTKPTFGGTKATGVVETSASCKLKNPQGFKCWSYMPGSKKCVPGTDRGRKECKNASEHLEGAVPTILGIILFVHI